MDRLSLKRLCLGPARPTNPFSQIASGGGRLAGQPGSERGRRELTGDDGSRQAVSAPAETIPDHLPKQPLRPVSERIPGELPILPEMLEHPSERGFIAFSGSRIRQGRERASQSV